MTIGELMERLQELAYQFGDGIEVRIASQPSWPFEYDIKGMVSKNELFQNGEDYTADGKRSDKIGEDVVWIVEGNQMGYFTKDAWDACY
jgi:hypothetical protein